MISAVPLRPRRAVAVGGSNCYDTMNIWVFFSSLYFLGNHLGYGVHLGLRIVEVGMLMSDWLAGPFLLSEAKRGAWLSWAFF